jgi:protein-S-isoprenylcysteine O-methyltransferase Ste14
MEDLTKRAFGGLVRLVISMGVLLFVPPWTLNYWQAWTFLAVFSGSVLAITLYLMKKDPKLLERRLNSGPRAEKEKTQKIIQSLAAVAFVAVVVFPAIDHRFAWSTTPPYVVVVGNVLVALGLLIVFMVPVQQRGRLDCVADGDAR